jgi:gamma-glutamyltranspeptidase/glutathione hydrolase
VVVPGTGIALQNRGCGFSLEAGHPNEVGPRKRPFHTIIPGFLTRDGKPVMAFGMMGGPIQAQGHVQLVVRIVDHGQNPQAASDAPRWRVLGGRRVALEIGHDENVQAELKRRGHEVEILDFTQFGGAQIVYTTGSGYIAASDHRKDGQAAGF